MAKFRKLLFLRHCKSYHQLINCLLLLIIAFFCYQISINCQHGLLPTKPQVVITSVAKTRPAQLSRDHIIFGTQLKSNLSVVTESTPSSFDTFSLPRLMSCQKPALKSIIVAEKTIPLMTVAKCIKFCWSKTALYAALFNGSSCYCTNVHGSENLDKDSNCNVACRGDLALRCGGSDQWMFYKIAEADGERGWTTWMSYGRTEKDMNVYRTRYRGCPGDKRSRRSCLVHLHKSGSAVKTNVSPLIIDHFIGCFTNQAWDLPDNRLILAKYSVNTTQDCITSCQTIGSLYSILNVKNCICSNSLGWSRPIDTCVYGFGALVFSTSLLKSDGVTLKFEERLTQRQVAVVAHYRGGSTFASLMFSNYPNSLYVFEPASVFGAVWVGVNNSLARETERSRIFLERIYPLWFKCHAQDLPGIWLTKYPGWGNHNSGFSVFNSCKKAVGSLTGAYKCSAFIEEKCLISPVVAAKTTRMVHSQNVKRFAQIETDIHVLHAFRDPRAQLSSRAQLERVYRKNQLSHLTTSCWELNELSTVFNDDLKDAPNTHVVHYEDLARDVISSAKQIYREMNFTLPGEVIRTLQESTGKGKVKKAEKKYAYGTIKNDPTSLIDSWKKKLNHSMVNIADNSTECRKLFAKYPDKFKPLRDMSS